MQRGRTLPAEGQGPDHEHGAHVPAERTRLTIAKELIKTAVLEIGVAPNFVDPNNPATPLASIQSRSPKASQSHWGTCAVAAGPRCIVRLRPTGRRRRRSHVVVTGGGVREPPQYLHLFERVLNAFRTRSDASIGCVRAMHHALTGWA